MNRETIYRQDVLDLAKKGVLISNGSYKSVCKAINEIPPVNPQPCEDAISRQAVQDYVAKYLSQYLYNDVREAVEVIDEYIGELPSVTPQPKTGHWIHFASGDDCSECGWSTGKYISPSKYCPNCGAMMVEPQEREEG